MTDYIKPREAAIELGVTTTTIYNLIRSDKIKTTILMDNLVIPIDFWKTFKRQYLIAKGK